MCCLWERTPPARLYADPRPRDSVQLCLLENGHLAYILDLGVISVWRETAISLEKAKATVSVAEVSDSCG